jgi:hypothetical protein
MTEYDESLFSNNPDVVAGDQCIIFNARDGEKIALHKGFNLGVGDTIVVHHTSDGDLVTHGNSRIGIGDTVVVVPLVDGDLAALNPGLNPYRDCPLIDKSTHDYSQQHDPADDTYQYHAYSIHLSDLIGWGDYVNARFDFEIGSEQLGGVQPWYPYGGAWIGLGASNTGGNVNQGSWWWPGGNPYLTIRGQPAVTLGPNGNATLVGVLKNGGSTWVIEDFIGHLYPYGLISWDIEYIHIHISQQSTLFFYNYTDTRMPYSHFCKGTVRYGWDAPINNFE